MGLFKKGLDETIEWSWGIDVCSTRCMGAGADQNVIMVAYGKIISGLIPLNYLDYIYLDTEHGHRSA